MLKYEICLKKLPIAIANILKRNKQQHRAIPRKRGFEN
jgi:hypothetical protein